MVRNRYRSALDRYRKELQRNLLATPGVHPVVLVLDGLKADYNVAKILRSAEVFGVREVHLVNIDPFDPAPAKGALRKVPVRLFSTFAESYAVLTAAGYQFCLLGPTAGESLGTLSLTKKTAFILGHEEFGPSVDEKDFPGLRKLKIPQFGETESLNVSVAAGIVLYEYVRQCGSSSRG